MKIKGIVLTAVVLLVLFSTVSSAAQQEASFRVKYLSADHVYLDGGSAEGLTAGDKLEIKRNNRTIATLEVVYTSEHSASCKILESSGAITVGEKAVVTLKQEEGIEPEKIDSTAVRKRTVPESRQRRSKSARNRSQIRGSVAIQYYHWNDLEETGLDFSQPTVRLNIKGKNLWNRDINFRLKTRTRYNQRSRRLNPDAPAKEWRNRIYELSLSYENEEALFNYQVGRIISNKFSGIGYIDGALVQSNLTSRFAAGIFGGTQPDWKYSDFQTSIQKYGGYLNYKSGDYSSRRLETTFAAAGEYHGGTVSREFLYLQNSLYFYRRWNLYHSMELDINRGWREERTGEKFTLSNLYISGNWQATSWLSMGLMYDNRKNYITYETQSIADSLFDDALRQGLRGTLSLTLPSQFRMFGNFGFRKRQTNSEYTYSYAGGLSKNNFLLKNLSVFVNGAGFSNFFTRGLNYSTRVSKYLGTFMNLDLSFGGYTYELKSNNNSRKNQWFRAGGFGNLTRKFYLSAQYEYDWGDDVHGHRILSEIGYRFY